LLCCWWCSLAHAAPPGRTVSVGVYDNAPKVYIDARGRADGILIDLLREVARNEGWKLTFVHCKWAQCLEALEAGTIDLLPDVAWSEERSRRFDFPQVPALFSWSQLYRRPDMPIGTVASISGKRIAVLSGSIQERYFADFASGFGAAPKLLPVASVAEGFELVRSGRADAAVASKFAGDFHAKRYGIVETSIMFQPVRLFYAAGKGRNGELLATLDRKLGAWQADPDSVYFSILDRWESRGLLARVPNYVWWGSGLILALLGTTLGLAAWLRRQVGRKSGALKETEQRLATILDSVDSLVYIKDSASHYRYANRALHAFLGLPGHEVIGRSDADLFAPAVAARVRHDDLRAMEQRQRIVTEETVPDAQGRAITLLTTKIPLSREDGSLSGICGISIDITERRAAEEANRIAATVFQSAEGMFIASPERRILRVNQAFCEMRGCGPDEMVGSPLPPFSLVRDGTSANQAMWEAVERSGKWQGEVWYRHPHGESCPMRLTVTAVHDDRGRLTHFVGTQGDISAQKRAQEEIVQLAFYDPLTGLPNRRLLHERLQHCLKAGERRTQGAALLFLDLDHFKDLNDLYGHGAGDRLLCLVTRRVVDCTRAGDTVARLGGDEFVVLLENLAGGENEASLQVAATGKKILAAVREPFDLDGQLHHATCSVGAVLCRDGATDIDTVMRQADMAMYAAKRDGRNTLRFFHHGMESEVSRRHALEAELRAAQDGMGLALLYQPQVDDGGRIVGAEALLRWESPSRGQVGPAEFIPVAEACGLITTMGRWVLRSACAQLAAWAGQAGMHHLLLAVNVSVHQLRQPDFVDMVLQTVAEFRVTPSLLKLELTESVLIADIDDTIVKMHALKQAGLSFALDDFGTGYSSLSYLKRLPLDQLKIDRSFVRDILDNPNDAAIARSIVALGRSLGLGIVAEGVEVDAQRRFLAEIGCDCYQGYLFGKPMDAGALAALLRAQTETALPRDGA
jgi:diguanylate cyclase (GGDEF)-like protein/PAS domain S-box-containing protein